MKGSSPRPAMEGSSPCPHKGRELSPRYGLPWRGVRRALERPPMEGSSPRLQFIASSARPPKGSSPCSFRTGRAAALAVVNRGAVNEKVEMGRGKRLGIQTHRIFFEEKKRGGLPGCSIHAGSTSELCQRVKSSVDYLVRMCSIIAFHPPRPETFSFSTVPRCRESLHRSTPTRLHRQAMTTP
jgi:hypothetical protein